MTDKNDKILQMFFEIDRWTKAIEKGVTKDIRKEQLILLTAEPTRLEMADAMLNGKYEIAPPHTAQIPKGDGEFRTVYVNEPIDRIVLSIANDLLFDLMPEMVHKLVASLTRRASAVVRLWLKSAIKLRILHQLAIWDGSQTLASISIAYLFNT